MRSEWYTIIEKQYIEGKNNPDKVKYDTPELQDILDVTYGVMVYQVVI